MIVAVCSLNRRVFGGGIGYKNGIPWKLSADMKYFKKLTIGNGNNAVIMGRKTWESLPSTLPKRDNLILSRTLPNAFNSVDELEKHIAKKNYSDVWVIGGNTIYEQFIDKTRHLYVTNIDKHYTCDTFFIRPSGFELVKSGEMFVEKDIPYQFLEFINRKEDYR